MIRIGDFSKLSRVSIKALRYYDEMGLLKPIEVDRFTGYRYYEFDQLPRLYRTAGFASVALKDLGFSLEEIGRFLEGGLPAEELRGMLKLRQAEIRQRVEEEAGRLQRVELWLRQIEQEDTLMSKYDVVIKKIEPVRVASVRGVVPIPPDQGALWGELMGYLNQQSARMIGPPLAVYHDGEFKERDWDIEVCMPIIDPMTPDQRLNVHNLPGVETMACVVHAGPFLTIGEAYDALAKWIDQNGYRIVGPGGRLICGRPSRPATKMIRTHSTRFSSRWRRGSGKTVHGCHGKSRMPRKPFKKIREISDVPCHPCTNDG